MLSSESTSVVEPLLYDPPEPEYDPSLPCAWVAWSTSQHFLHDVEDRRAYHRFDHGREPRMLDQLDSRRPFGRVERDTLLDEVYSDVRHLRRVGQRRMLRRDTDVEHDSPDRQDWLQTTTFQSADPHHSLSRLLHGFRPVTISSRQQPMDQMSELPNRPVFSFLITSGAMYMGVPAKEFMTAAPSAPGAFVRLATRVRAMVLLPLAMTLAAPKSTNLMVELVPSRISEA